ncbi:MAG: purine permease [Solirubrobacterales bacterium]|nr:purine permease [Solirubrobacterales bacterium]MBV9363483.1 purine permease [Solirubrobacterales bacterium]MBV9809714.1 purine permease [Solirubrobacterales bacterium]
MSVIGATSQSERSRKPHPVDEVLPAPRLVILGVQHLFIMYAGAVAVPLLVGSALNLSTKTIGLLVNADLLVSGIATIIQSAGIRNILGVRLPVVAGATFTVVTPFIVIAQKYGIQAVYGAMLVSGVFGLLMAKPFSTITRFFPPLVAGTVITVIGLSLIGADVSLIAGNDPTAPSFGPESHILLAGLVVLLIIFITRFFRGFIGQIAVLLSIAIGTLVAWPMGLLHFGSVSHAKVVGFSGFFHFGGPKFQAAAIISMCIVMLVTFTESTADMLAVSDMVDRPLSPNDLARGLATDALSAFIASFTNSFPDTAFAENVGLVEITRVRSRWVVTVCGVCLVILGVLPKVGQVVANIPGPVIGAAATVMFGMVAAVGIRILQKVSYAGNNNLLIVAVSISFGLIPAFAPNFYQHFPKNLQVIFDSSITSTVIAAFLLNLLFNHWRRPGESAVGLGGEALADELNRPEVAERAAAPHAGPAPNNTESSAVGESQPQAPTARWGGGE